MHPLTPEGLVTKERHNGCRALHSRKKKDKEKRHKGQDTEIYNTNKPQLLPQL
jgi:hypothetical protein